MPNATLEQTVAAMLSLAQGDKLPTRAAVIAKLALPPDPLTLDMGIYGQAMNDAKKALAAAKVPVMAKTLDSPLIDLFVAGSMDKTMYRYDKALMQLIKTSKDFKPPQERMIQKLVTALAQCEHQHTLARSHTRAVSVRSFLEADDKAQMGTVNAVWDECTLSVVYDRKTEQMYEPDGAVQLLGASQLPSSVHPVRERGGEAKTFTRGAGGQPFTKLKVGFRVEGSANSKNGEGPSKLDDDIKRILEKGMVPQVTIDWLMMRNGKDIDGTKIALDTTKARLNIEQKDLWNESGVCVARSLFGSTAFPLRDHVGPALLWAVDVTDLTGYDTEGWQLANPGAGAGPWRPGEKCYAKVPADRILGYVIIEKQGDVGGGWKFSVPRGSKWKSTGFPTMAQGQYMEQELAAWDGVTATVPTLYDFQQ